MKALLFSSLMMTMASLNAQETCSDMMKGMSCDEIKSSSAQIYNMCCTDGSESSEVSGKESLFDDEDISAIVKKIEERQRMRSERRSRRVPTEVSKQEKHDKAAAKYVVDTLKYMDKYEQWRKCEETPMYKGSCGKEPEAPLAPFNKSTSRSERPNKEPCVISKGSEREFCDGVEYRAVKPHYIGEASRELIEKSDHINDISILRSKIVGDVEAPESSGAQRSPASVIDN